jgi:hypothetical protein
LVTVRYDRTAAPISSIMARSVLQLMLAFSERGPHVGDVLLSRHREHRRALFLPHGDLILSDGSRRVRAAVAEARL